MAYAAAGKRVLITGASSGLGAALARRLAGQEAVVGLIARRRDRLGEVLADCRRTSPGSVMWVADLADAAALRDLALQAWDVLGGIDVLINNASGFGLTNDEAGWAASVSVDLMATVRASEAALPFLKQSSAAAIINTSSISALQPSARTPPYGAAKAAVVDYTQSQAVTLAPARIRVNSVAPGSIEFPGGMWEQRKNAEPALYNRILSTIPFGRLGRPEEVANAVLFFASDDASWITGHTLVVDGGQMLT
jgi:3-oxoacyl-[acyl-carrier protein] reductase